MGESLLLSEFPLLGRERLAPRGEEAWLISFDRSAASMRTTLTAKLNEGNFQQAKLGVEAQGFGFNWFGCLGWFFLGWFLFKFKLMGKRLVSARMKTKIARKSQKDAHLLLKSNQHD